LLQSKIIQELYLSTYLLAIISFPHLKIQRVPEYVSVLEMPRLVLKIITLQQESFTEQEQELLERWRPRPAQPTQAGAATNAPSRSRRKPAPRK